MILLPVKSVLTKSNDILHLNQLHLYKHLNRGGTTTKYRWILDPSNIIQWDKIKSDCKRLLHFQNILL